MLNRISKSFHVVLVAMATIAVALVAGREYVNRTETRQIVIAGGAANSEAFVLMQALKAVTEKYYPRFQIQVHETSGTKENVDALNRGEAQLATAQADGLGHANAETVAVLYDDVFQILAHKDRNIQQFADLKGKRIAVPVAGGQKDTFLYVADHYGLSESDFTFVGPSDESADLAYVKNDADAVFRVRALHNASTARLAASGISVVVPIEQAAALHLDYPGWSPTIIPQGAFVGRPAVPEADTITVSAPRFLVARRGTDYDLVFAVTQVLMEHRQDLLAAIPETQSAVQPLAANAQPPNPRVGLGSAIHPAARDYYDRTRVPWVARFADWVGALVGLAALAALWSLALRKRRRILQSANAVQFRQRAAALIEEARTASKGRELQAISGELISLVPRAVEGLDERQLSDADLQTVRALAQFGLEVVRERMRGDEPPESAPESDPVAASNGEETRGSWWKFRRRR